MYIDKHGYIYLYAFWKQIVAIFLKTYNEHITTCSNAKHEL